jgi:hypothetical protein
MGFFSWRTVNTDRSIPSAYSTRKPFHVIMVAPDGRMWSEPEYEGYGDFGGKDYYELLAEINGLESDRSKGIDLAFHPEKYNIDNIKHPQLVEANSEEDIRMSSLDFSTPPPDCEHQGYFYD